MEEKDDPVTWTVTVCITGSQQCGVLASTWHLGVCWSSGLRGAVCH